MLQTNMGDVVQVIAFDTSVNNTSPSGRLIPVPTWADKAGCRSMFVFLSEPDRNGLAC
jgi:hypothetical protein